MNRYSLEPLAATLHIELHHIGGQTEDAPADGHTALALILGVTTRRIRYAATQGLTYVTADRWACRAGLHPSAVWPSWRHDSSESIAGACTCKELQRPLGAICDRCGRLLAHAGRVAA